MLLPESDWVKLAPEPKADEVGSHILSPRSGSGSWGSLRVGPPRALCGSGSSYKTSSDATEAGWVAGSPWKGPRVGTTHHLTSFDSLQPQGQENYVGYISVGRQCQPRKGSHKI